MRSIVYNQDCLEAMRQMPDKAFDLAICDPPYGGYALKENSSCAMFANIEPPAEYWAELIRVSKNQIVWGVNYFTEVNLAGGSIIWNKLGNQTERRKQAPTISDAEIAYQSFNKLVKMFSYAWIGNVVSNEYVINSVEFVQRIHPTQKPVALYKWLLTNYAKPGDTILDTHMGSQSSRIAAWDLGFDFTGFELDEDYYKAGCERFEIHTAQAKLFDAPVLETVEQNNLF